MYRLIAQSPTTLQGFTSNGAALTKTLDVKTRERIALAVAQVNGCDYCLSAHTYLGLNLAKISPEEIAQNRKGASGDAKANAAVQFAAKVVRERGHVTDADIKAVRDAGYSDGQIVEILAVTAENVLHQPAQRGRGDRHRLPGRPRRRSRVMPIGPGLAPPRPAFLPSAEARSCPMAFSISP